MSLTEGEKTVGWREHLVVARDGTEMTIKVDPLTESTLEDIMTMMRLYADKNVMRIAESMFLWGYEMGKGQGKLDAALDATGRAQAKVKTINRVGIPPPDVRRETFEEVLASMETQKQREDILRAKSICPDWGHLCSYFCPRVDLEKCLVPKKWPTTRKAVKKGSP